MKHSSANAAFQNPLELSMAHTEACVSNNPDGTWDVLFYYQIETVVNPIVCLDKTDIMLVQYLVRQYFLTVSASPGSRNAFISIYNSATSGRRRWDDGVYGPATRKAIALFELEVSAPDRDGYVHPIYSDVKPGWDDATTKLEKLNWVYAAAIDGELRTNTYRRILMKREGNPVLYKAVHRR